MSVETIFAAAAQKPNTERPAYLEEACGTDAELRRKVERLLKAHDAAGDFLESPAERPAGTVDYAPISEKPGSMIGPYKLKEQIGEGGMGEVWLAEQLEPVRRQVALKLIKAGMDSRQVIARFEAERQALAVMDHPNIAKVFDGGLHNGRPYFVMELVKGVPITQYCDAKKLTPQERLELFVPVCQAIQHAHQKGIIHRDIKPSNVLIAPYDDKPVPKVIDFGLAKATGVSLTDASQATNFGGVVGTPQYMSPEQASLNNLDIDTRSDIYSLGVLLYELLTGCPPFNQKELEKAGMLEMLRMIREVEPPKPSTKLSTAVALPGLSANRGTEPKKLTGLLRNELDWIVMKALEKDRARRYDTANGFAADIDRYLNGEAIQAHPPSAAYRLRKFVRRNRGAVIAVSAVFLALVGGLVMLYGGVTAAYYGLKRAREAENAARADQIEAVKQRNAAEVQRNRAEKARDRTRDVLDAMTSSATGDSLGTQKEISDDQKKFLAEVLTYYREFAGEDADDERARQRQAHAATRVGAIEYRLGRLSESATANRMARDLYIALAADFPAQLKYRQTVARSENDLALLLAGLGKREEAEREYRKALEIQMGLVVDFPTEAAYLEEMARSRYNLAILLDSHGKRVEAESEHRQALATFQKLAADFPAQPKYREEVAQSANGIGALLVGLGRQGEAMEPFRRAVATFEKLVREFPTVITYQRGLALSHNNLGGLLHESGEPADAAQEYRLAQALHAKLVADFPAQPAHRQELAGSHNNLALSLMDSGKRTEAASELRSAVAIREKLAADFPNSRKYQVQLGGSYGIYGTLIRDEGNPGESLKWFDLAIGTLTPLFEKESRDVTAREYLSNSHWSRAQAFDGLKKPTEAIKDWNRAIELSPLTEQPSLRASRATSQLQAGMVAEAVADVADLTKSPEWNAGQWYNFACVYAVASGKIADNKRDYADRAIELLQKAVKAGYNNFAHMKKDTDLAPLRDREDFKKLVAEMEKGAEKK